MGQDMLMTDEFIYQACKDASRMRSGFIAAGHIAEMTGLSKSRVFQGFKRLTKRMLIHQRHTMGPYFLTEAPASVRGPSSATPSAPRGGEGSGAGSEGV